MLKYQEIIKNLSINEKIDLILSSNRCGNKTISNYELPVLKNVSNSEILTQGKLKSFHFLGLTWNQELIRNIGASIGRCNHDHIVNFSMLNENNEGYFSSNSYLAGKIVGNLLKGIESEKTLTSLSCIPNNSIDNVNYHLNTLESFDIALKMSSPFIIETSNPNIKDLTSKLEYKGYVSYNEIEPNTVPKALYNEALFVTSENKEEIINAINLYYEYQKKLSNGEISKAHFDEQERRGVIFDPNKLDSMVDKVLIALSEYDAATTKYTNEINPFNLKDYCHESILMLKNNEILPLDGSKCSLVGELFEKEFDDGSSILSIIPDYLIPTTNYARGYVEGIESDNLFDPVKEELLDSKSKYMIILLESKDGYLSSAALEFLDKVNHCNEFDKKLILVVSGNEMLKVRLEDYFDALLFMPGFSKDYAEALLDILLGKYNPSAKVCHEVYEKNDTEHNDDEKSPIYPLGFGLSYSKFMYTNEEFTKTSVKVTVENSSEYDGTQVVQVYTRCPFENSLRLAGFKKIFLHAGEKEILRIPLDDKAFRYYNEEKGLYGIKSGTYEVYLAENIDNIFWSSSVELEDYLHDKYEFSDEVMTESGLNMNGFTDFTNSSSKIDQNINHRMSFAKKITIGILVDLYLTAFFVAMIIVTLNQNVNSDSAFLSSMVMGVLATITNAFFIVFLIKSILKRNRDKKCIVREYATVQEMLKDTSYFNEIARVCYENPVLDASDELNILKENLEEEHENVSIDEHDDVKEDENTPNGETINEDFEADEAYDDEEYDDSYVPTPIVYEEKENYQNMSLDDLCVKFNSFALESGYLLELPQIRALLAAVLSNKLIFVNSNKNECLIKVLALLDKFFGNEMRPLVVSDDVYRMKDILWKPEDDKYVYSDFTIDLLKAKNNQNGIKLFVVDNVSMDTFPKYFYKFIKQSSTPKLPQYIKLEKKYELPTNVCYFIIPKEENYMEHASFKLMEAALSLYLNIGIMDAKEVDIEPVSYKRLQEQLDTAKFSLYLDEDEWKKIDDLEDDLNEKEPSYKHSNISALLIERLCTAFLTLDPERYLLDDVLAMHYIPLIKCTELYKKTNGELEVKEILNQIFGSDNIPLALKVLAKAGDAHEEQANNEIPEETDESKETEALESSENVELKENTVNLEENLTSEQKNIEKVTNDSSEEGIKEDAKPAAKKTTVKKITSAKAKAKTESKDEKPAAKKTAAKKTDTKTDVADEKPAAKKTVTKKTAKKADIADEKAAAKRTATRKTTTKTSKTKE